MAALLYGAGLRLRDCVRLRVKDIGLDTGQITARDGKGRKDCVTMLPRSLREPLARQLQRVGLPHEDDRAAGLPGVSLPDALDRKSPGAGQELGWQWAFPTRTQS